MIALWIRAANKTAITGYIQQIERILERDPLEQGEERVGTVRILFHRPICVLYQVDDVAKSVTVMAVKWSGR